MTRRRMIATLCGVLTAGMLAVAPRPSGAVNIVLDYSRDTSLFFGAGNPTGQGASAKAALQAVATFYSTILTDTLSPVVEPPDFSGTLGGSAYWNWSVQIIHPATGASEVLPGLSIAADEYRIYVGARSIPTIGVLGIGGTSTTTPGYGYQGPWAPGEFDYVQQTVTDFASAVTKRGETSGYGNWGGYLTFDSDASTGWHYNHNTAPTPGTSDFYSVAIHEIAHTLGFGTSSEWRNMATGAEFTGAAAAAAYGGPPPLENPNPTRGHWASGTLSKILGTNTTQAAAMDPQLTQGTRKHLTSLDAGALTDIGWTVVAPTFNSADFNRDGIVNAPDLAVWRAGFGPTAAASADGDGDTDGNDFLLWQRRLGQVGAIQSAGSGVPEPTGAALAAWLVILLARRRTCRLA